MTNLILENPAFTLFSLLFIIEQIAIYFPGSFPYRFGIPVSTESFPIDKFEKQEIKHQTFSNLVVKDKKSKGIYFRYKYPPLVLGPILFVGQVNNKQKDKLKIRLAPLSVVFLCFLVISPLIYGKDIHIENPLFLIAIVLFLYFRFHSVYKKHIITN